jgi:uroporphyrin-III C-methyltransferase/precorrin-2 dehydrogenase/sirohydrochlorin ferrochelatase
MQRADVVLYDRLIGKGILNLVRRDAERIYVGKLPQEHTVEQHEISAMLLRLAQEGKRVLRLKGGDPFIFGRGGEEIELLAQAGIPFQVVPGITAASGCAAYAGIPLTHRDHAQACVFVTGHAKDGQLDLDWNALLQPRQTVAVYMGLAQLAELTRAFVEKGAAPSLPAALIDNGTRPNQNVLIGTLDTIARQAAEAGVKGPAILIVGSVVRLREKLDWYVPEEQARDAKPGMTGTPAPASAVE